MKKEPWWPKRRSNAWWTYLCDIESGVTGDPFVAQVEIMWRKRALLNSQGSGRTCTPNVNVVLRLIEISSDWADSDVVWETKCTVVPDLLALTEIGRKVKVTVPVRISVPPDVYTSIYEWRGAHWQLSITAQSTRKKKEIHCRVPLYLYSDENESVSRVQPSPTADYVD